MKKKTVKEVKIYEFLVCVYKSQDFAQCQDNFAQSHDCETVTFKNSALWRPIKPIFSCKAEKPVFRPDTTRFPSVGSLFTDGVVSNTGISSYITLYVCHNGSLWCIPKDDTAIGADRQKCAAGDCQN